MSRRGVAHRLAVVLCLVAQMVMGMAPAGTVVTLRMPCPCNQASGQASGEASAEDGAVPCCAACVPVASVDVGARSGGPACVDSPAACPCCAAEQSASTCADGDARLPAEGPDSGERAGATSSGDLAQCQLGCLPGCLCCLNIETPQLPAMGAPTAREIDPLLPCAGSIAAMSVVVRAGAWCAADAREACGVGWAGNWTTGELRALAARPLGHVRLLV